MKTKLFQVLSLLVLLLVTSCQGQTAQKVTVDAFDGKLNTTENKIILDVRTAEEFGRGHLADAVNVDYYGSDFKNELAKLDKTKPVFVYCKAGTRSGASAKILAELGFKEIYDLQGGFDAWKDAKKPVVQ